MRSGRAVQLIFRCHPDTELRSAMLGLISGKILVKDATQSTRWERLGQIHRRSNRTLIGSADLADA